MDMSEHPALADILFAWVERMASSDAMTIRDEMWYPSEAKILRGGWSRSECACECLGAENESKKMLVVDRAVNDLPIPLREALHISLGMEKNVWYYLVNCDDLPPAYKAYAHQQLGDGIGACVKARRVTQPMIEAWLLDNLPKMAQEARERVWRALRAEGLS